MDRRSLLVSSLVASGVLAAGRARAVDSAADSFSHLTLLAALALTGHDAEAREALRRYVALPPNGPLKTIAAWKAHQTFIGGDPRFVEMNERTYDACVKQGCPSNDR
jgi:hypothetical protein